MSPMVMLLVVLGVSISVLVILLIYRNTLEMHEDDQLFIGSAESHMAKEQEELQVKMTRLEPLVRWVGALCGVVLLTIAGMWIYGGLNRPLS